MTHNLESGRTLMETMATLAIIGVLSVGAVKLYNYTTTRVKAQNTAKMIKTLALERQNFAMKASTGGRTRVKGPHSDLYVENGVAGKYSKYFWVETTLKDSAFCEALKESDLIQADLIEVNDTIDGVCSDDSKLAFYFKKNPSTDETLTWVDGEGNVQKCPKGSATCDSEGNATSCESGYYLVDGTCDQCGTHVATCEDENTPISCQEGYELHWGQCITPPQMCTMDSDCDVCATCDTETGRCQNSCEVPTQRCYKDADCGDNDCIVCDTDEHSCKNTCEKVEYLKSTGTQGIDTGIVGNLDTSYEITAKTTQASGSNVAILIGSRSDASSNNITTFYPSEKSKIINDFGNFDITRQRYTSSNILSKFKFYNSKSKRSITNLDTGEYNEVTKSYSSDFTTPNNIHIGLKTSGYIDSMVNFSGYLYGCKMWDNNALVRDFIPVIAPNDRPAMFDRVTKKLFYNQGTDEFLTD